MRAQFVCIAMGVLVWLASTSTPAWADKKRGSTQSWIALREMCGTLTSWSLP